MTTISFNAPATQALSTRRGNKLRMEIRNGTMFVRPTDRKAGPHVLVEIDAKGKTGASVTLDEKQMEKLGANKVLEHNAAFHVVADKYGWYALQSGDESEEKAAGGKASVARK